MRDTIVIKVPGRVIVYVDRVKMMDTTNDSELARKLLKDRSYLLITAENNPPHYKLLHIFWKEDRFEFPFDLSLGFWEACWH